MAAKKKAKEPNIDDLVKLAEELNLPSGAFDGDIDDLCEEQARLHAENVKRDTLRDQLEFLNQGGFYRSRLAQLIRELSEESE